MKLTKAIFLPVFALFTCTYTSCIEDVGNHMLQMEYPVPYQVLYADQTTDSIIFSTFESYIINIHSDWVSLEGNPSYNFLYDGSKVYTFSRYLNFQTNTTGHTRSTVVGVNSYQYQTGARFYQLGYLNITRPLPMEYSFVYSNIPDTVKFELKDSANVSLDSIVFRVQQYWDLAIDRADTVSWLSIDGSSDGTKDGSGGKYAIKLNIQKNKDMDRDRVATILLSSGEPTVTNSITIRQLKATKEQYDKMLEE